MDNWTDVQYSGWTIGRMCSIADQQSTLPCYLLDVIICTKHTKVHLNNNLRYSIMFNVYTVKPLTNTSEEFIKCRLDNFSMSFILYFVNFSICENE